MTAPAGLSEDTRCNPMLLPSVARGKKRVVISCELPLDQRNEQRIGTVMGVIPCFKMSKLDPAFHQLNVAPFPISSFVMIRYCLVVVKQQYAMFILDRHL
ncbi:hypothetical protein ElyMa_003304800 [Elysia marginata]|uniref:Uncharacterized protein n=1 Tax=Elysia marginata TaxID=1093978 RepID=A0AAV4JDC8_9GAST|nr:hypothetical protein ElyMa_003304800 [Elysia marginata]